MKHNTSCVSPLQILFLALLILKHSNCFISNNKINKSILISPKSSRKSSIDQCYPNIQRQFNQCHHYQKQKVIKNRLFAVSVNEDIEDTRTSEINDKDNKNKDKSNIKISKSIPNVVLVAGFESFNRQLFYDASKQLPKGVEINLLVFSDDEIRDKKTGKTDDNFKLAMENADAFIGSLIFDYDDALAVKELLPLIDDGPRFVFESATELMSFNRVGKFSMGDGMKDGTPSGPPPAVKAILSKFSSGKEEDKLQGYTKLLKVGPDLLKFIPGDNKLSDLRNWLEAYRYWSQSGKNNVSSMFQLISQRLLSSKRLIPPSNIPIPELEITPDIGLLHPLKKLSPRYFTSPSDYLSWRLSSSCKNDAQTHKIKLAPDTAPKVAILLYRKHVVSNEKLICYVFS